MSAIYTREIKAITGNGTNQVKITPSPGKRLHGLQITLTWAAGVSTSGDTLAEQLDAINAIRVLVGSKVVRRLESITINSVVHSAGDLLRDYCLLNGTAHDFDSPSTYVAIIYIPFAEDWFVANVADSLAWNPALLGGPITVEMDFGALNTSYYPTLVVKERISDDLDAPSAGIISWNWITPGAGGTSFFVEGNVLKPEGKLIQLSIYPDTINAREITPVTLYGGPDDLTVWDNVSSAENDDLLGRAGLTPAASGRSANVYDLVAVRGDALSHAFPMSAWKQSKLKVGAASAMAGTCGILVARLEDMAIGR